MDIWQKAKNLAEEAAKRTQTLTTSTRIADIVSETAKRSKEFAAEAKAVADHRIKSLTDQIPSITLLNASSPFSDDPIPLDLEKFGITDDLRQFARGFTVTTFQNFPIHDDSVVSDVPTLSNVRQDLTDWQQKHASLVLTTVKEISRLRYELCPRHMKDGRFWRIYFTLVSSHVSPYEKEYNEEIQAKEAEAQRVEKSDTIEEGDKSGGGTAVNQKSLRSTSSTADEDLDSFLLGDIDDAADGEDNFEDDDDDDDDDFDKIDSLDAEDDRI
ncbi:aspartic acid-rich protein-like [Impatiens glandulifera]|uniref:aspartic acid-rich protein-like n=1 Tax=Impatiens glandulifera TaxID=253017 RepID=UPI001FB08550|nr:aspartic acid-rich protein-like [Impatiens glandulifera]